MTQARKTTSQKQLDKGYLPPNERAQLKAQRSNNTKCTEVPKPKGLLTPSQRLAFNQLCRSLIEADVLNAEDVYAVEEIAVLIDAARVARANWSKHRSLTISITNPSSGNTVMKEHPDFAVLQKIQANLMRMMVQSGLTPRSRDMLSRMVDEREYAEHTNRKKGNDFDDLPGDDEGEGDAE